MIESLLHQVNNSDTFSLTLRAKLLYITWTTGICFKIGFGEVSRVIALILYGLVNLSRNLKRKISNIFRYFCHSLSAWRNPEMNCLRLLRQFYCRPNRSPLILKSCPNEHKYKLNFCAPIIVNVFLIISRINQLYPVKVLSQSCRLKM